MPKPGSSDPPSFESGSDEFFVERLLLAAKDYVVPTDQLRPQVMDEAREIHDQKIGSRWIGRSILATALLFWGTLLSTPFLQSIQAKQIEDRNFVERRSQELFESGKVEIQSATSQAYAEWRESMSDRLLAH